MFAGLLKSMIHGPKAADEAVFSGLVHNMGPWLRVRRTDGARVDSGYCTKRALIVGTDGLAGALIDAIDARPSSRYVVVGAVRVTVASERAESRYPVLGSAERLVEIVEAIRPDVLILDCRDALSPIAMHQVLQCWLRGIQIRGATEVYEQVTGKVAIEHYTTTELVCCTAFQNFGAHALLSRAMSVWLALAVLVICAPFFLLIPVAIKLDSSGPIFIVQNRVGMRGKPFKLIKFRTMEAIDGDGSLWFHDNRHGVTRVGKWLRKFRLDELPQLINVLKGDMNLVGPRPHREEKFKLLALVWRNIPNSAQPIPYDFIRSLVRPGLTGWAQVRFSYAANLDEETEKMRYDLYYVKHRSVWLDLFILLKTVTIVLLGRNCGAALSTRRDRRRELSRAA